MYRNVVIPVDGSEGSVEAIDYGVDLAEVFDATVHFVYVVDERVYDHYARMDDVDSAEASLERNGEAALTAARTQVGSAGLNVVEHVARGVPHEVIVDYAEAVDADLVVMGTEQRDGDYRRLIGSVTERVVRACDRPVQVVKAEI